MPTALETIAANVKSFNGNTYSRIQDDNMSCPFCHGALYYRLIRFCKVEVTCLDDAHCENMVTAPDIESAVNLMSYNFETRDIPAITAPDTNDEFER
jgi:hypothetical protein